MNDKLTLKILREEDLSNIIKTFNFPWTTFEATKKKWERYFAEQQKNIRIVCIVKIRDEYVGYGSLLWVSEYAGFRDSDIPEINDVWILTEHRGHGFGTELIQYLENYAQQENYKKIGIGVGLYKDYGSAQKLYVQMGYIPDGNGVTYKCQPVVPGDSYPVDDDLVLWLKKDNLNLSRQG